MISFGFAAQSYTNNGFSKIKLFDVGRFLMPSVKEKQVHSALEYFNGSKIVKGDRLPRLQ